MTENRSDEKYRDLIIRFITGNSSSDEQLIFNELISKNKEIEKSYHELVKVWELVEVEKINPELAFQKFIQKIKLNEKKQESVFVFKNSEFLKYFIRIAALFIVIISLFFIFSNSPKQYSNLTFDNKVINDTLPDGSIVSLNRNTSINYNNRRFNKNREVFLIGEADFRIKNLKNEPFIIHCDQLLIKVIGTNFNVKAYPSDSVIIVTVNQGKVLMQYPEKEKNFEYEKIIINDEIGLFNKRSKRIAKDIIEDKNYLAWMTGVLAYKETPLKKVIIDLENLYQVKITLNNEVLINNNLTAKFDNEDIETVLEAICIAFDLEIIKDKHGFILQKHG